MKTWENPEMMSLDLDMTENGGMPSANFDQQWFDENKALHVNFVKES